MLPAARRTSALNPARVAPHLTSGGLPSAHRQSDLLEDQIELEQKRLNVELLDPDVEIFFSFQIEPAPVRPSLRAGWASTLCS